MSFMVQEDVVQFQITVDDALFMEEVQSNADFSSIKPVKEKIKDLSWSGASN